jgi:hypothetical protein
MIVDDFDFVGIRFSPFKANAPLVVDANAVLALSVAMKRFQSIAWRLPQIRQQTGGMNGPELTKGGAFNRAEPLASLAPKNSFRFVIAKSSDHTFSVSRRTL